MILLNLDLTHARRTCSSHFHVKLQVDGLRVLMPWCIKDESYVVIRLRRTLWCPPIVSLCVSYLTFVSSRSDRFCRVTRALEEAGIAFQTFLISCWSLTCFHRLLSPPASLRVYTSRKDYIVPKSCKSEKLSKRSVPRPTAGIDGYAQVTSAVTYDTGDVEQQSGARTMRGPTMRAIHVDSMLCRKLAQALMHLTGWEWLFTIWFMSSASLALRAAFVTAHSIAAR